MCDGLMASPNSAGMACNNVIHPFESVSNQGSGSSYNPLDINLSGPKLFDSLFTSDDYIKIYKECGSKAASEFLAFSVEQHKHVDKILSVHCGAVRIASSQLGSNNSSSVGTGSAGKASGLSGAKFHAIKHATTWRRPVEVRRPIDTQGFCYSKLLQSDVVQTLGCSLGRWPTLTSLLKTNADQFKSFRVLSKFKYSGDSEQGHVEEIKSTGYNFMSLVARYASGVKFAPGTLGAVVNASGVSQISCGPHLRGNTLIGGDSSVGGFRASDFVGSGEVEKVVDVRYDLVDPKEGWLNGDVKLPFYEAVNNKQASVGGRMEVHTDSRFNFKDSRWYCNRRNYCSVNFTARFTSIPSDITILKFSLIGLQRREDTTIRLHDHSSCGIVKLVQHNTKREVIGEVSSVQCDANVREFSSSFERVQFRNAVVNKSRSNIPKPVNHFCVSCEGYNGKEWVAVSSAMSLPLSVRGRAPGYFLMRDKDNGTGSDYEQFVKFMVHGSGVPGADAHLISPTSLKFFGTPTVDTFCI